MRKKINEIEIILGDDDWDIVCVNEPLRAWEVDVLKIGNFCLASRTTACGGGSLILLKPSITSIPVDYINELGLEKNCEICCVYLNELNVIVLNLYRDLAIFLGFRYLKAARIVVTGDFNVHFGSGDGDGTRLYDLMVAFSLKKMISVPTHGKNCIDNIFINFVSDVSEANSLSTAESDHSAVTLKEKEIKTYQNKRSSSISPNEFNDFFVGMAKKLINDLGSAVQM
ncbi:hypothetical protein HHI36_014910 [Cryptolaemus montrouzieri]|uniref:Endonuclease/exonuclease/phosphatase domain-containing protein n=1 Tax=Cryptolaemus montrouzieri TaxID=559131 RepID=A0ABD2N439_9CUCU